MPQTQLECRTDPLRLMPVGRRCGLSDVNPTPEMPFEEHLRRVSRTPTGAKTGQSAAAESAPRSSAGESDPAEDTDPSRSQPVADSDEDGNVREPAAAQGKTEPEEGQSDEESGTSDDEHAVAETGDSSALAIDIQIDAESGQPVPVSPDQKQQASDGQGDQQSRLVERMQQIEKTTQPAQLVPDQPALQPPSNGDAVPGEGAPVDAETTMTAEQPEGKFDGPNAAVSKETPATPKQANQGAELAAATSSCADAEPSEAPETGGGSGPKEETPRQTEQTGPIGNRPAVDDAPEPAPALESIASRQTPAEGTGQVLADTDVGSPEGDQKKAGAQETTEPTASGKTSQNESGGPVRVAAGQGSSQASTTPGQQAPAGGDVERARFVQRVARAFQAVGNSGGSVRLRLRPPDLGSLRLELTVRNGAMTARLEVETAAARNALLDNLPALRDRLAQQDIKIERFDVDLADDQSGGSPRQPGDHPQPGRHPAWNAPPPEDRPNVTTEDVSGPAPIARTSDGSQLNVVV